MATAAKTRRAKTGKKLKPARNAAGKMREAGMDVGKKDVLQMRPRDIIVIGIDEGDENSDLYDPRVTWPIPPAFEADVAAHGITSPVFATRDGIDKNGKHRIVLVAGRKRVLTARSITKKFYEANPNLDPEDPKTTPIRVPVLLIEGSMKELVLRAMGENALRENENYESMAWKARQARKMGADDEEIKATLNCRQPKLDALFCFIEFEPDIRKAFIAQGLPITAALKLSEAPRQDRPAVMEKLVAEQLRTAEHVEEAVAAHRNGENYKPPPRTVKNGHIKRPMLKTWTAELTARAKTTKSGLRAIHLEIAEAIVRRIRTGDKSALDKYPWIQPSFDVEDEVEAEGEEL